MDLSYGATGSYDQASIIIIATLGVGMALLFFLPGIGADGRTRVRVRTQEAAGELAMAG